MTESMISALVNYCGVTWQVEFSFETFIGLVHQIQTDCPNLILLAPRS